MAKGRDVPTRLNCKQAIKLLQVYGWELERGGKHVYKMTKPGHRPVTLTGPWSSAATSAAPGPGGSPAQAN